MTLRKLTRDAALRRADGAPATGAAANSAPVDHASRTLSRTGWGRTVRPPCADLSGARHGTSPAWLPRPGGGDVAGRSRRSTATTPRGKPRAGPRRAGLARARRRVARHIVRPRRRPHARGARRCGSAEHAQLQPNLLRGRRRASMSASRCGRANRADLCLRRAVRGSPRRSGSHSSYAALHFPSKSRISRLACSA